MTNEMKEHLNKAKTAEEAKNILENYAGELTEEELEAVTGGFSKWRPNKKDKSTYG